MSTDRRAVLAALGLLGAGCLIEAPQNVPDAPTARSLVVAAPTWSGDCAASCPTPARGEHLATCHVTSISGVLVDHRARLGERPSGYYLVCDYDHD